MVVDVGCGVGILVNCGVLGDLHHLRFDNFIISLFKSFQI